MPVNTLKSISKWQADYRRYLSDVRRQQPAPIMPAEPALETPMERAVLAEAKRQEDLAHARALDRQQANPYWKKPS
jgi:hypothetical protein